MKEKKAGSKGYKENRRNDIGEHFLHSTKIKNHSFRVVYYRLFLLCYKERLNKTHCRPVPSSLRSIPQVALQCGAVLSCEPVRHP